MSRNGFVSLNFYSVLFESSLGLFRQILFCVIFVYSNKENESKRRLVNKLQRLVNLFSAQS